MTLADPTSDPLLHYSIFSTLDHQSLLCCRLVCTLWQQLIDETYIPMHRFADVFRGKRFIENPSYNKQAVNRVIHRLLPPRAQSGGLFSILQGPSGTNLYHNDNLFLQNIQCDQIFTNGSRFLLLLSQQKYLCLDVASSQVFRVDCCLAQARFSSAFIQFPFLHFGDESGRVLSFTLDGYWLSTLQMNSAQLPIEHLFADEHAIIASTSDTLEYLDFRSPDQTVTTIQHPSRISQMTANGQRIFLLTKRGNAVVIYHRTLDYYYTWESDVTITSIEVQGNVLFALDADQSSLYILDHTKKQRLNCLSLLGCQITTFAVWGPIVTIATIEKKDPPLHLHTFKWEIF